MTDEIRAFEYSLGIFAVLIGLAIADVAVSFHKLLRNQKTVRWDPLALMAACYALVLAICMWFDFWGVRNFTATRHFLFYLSLVAEFFILFLIAATSLPDDPEGDCDLKSYYSDNRRKFWSLVTLFQIFYVVQGLFFIRRSALVELPIWLVVSLFAMMCAPLIVAFALTMVKSRKLDFVGFTLLFFVMFIHYVPSAIS
jgi:hypothetical protein